MISYYCVNPIDSEDRLEVAPDVEYVTFEAFSRDQSIAVHLDRRAVAALLSQLLDWHASAPPYGHGLHDSESCGAEACDLVNGEGAG